MPRDVVEHGFPDGNGIPADAEGANSRLSVVARKTVVAIRESAARNGLPVDRITQVRVLDPYSFPDHSKEEA